MPDSYNQNILSNTHNFESPYFVIGLIVIIVYAWKRFNIPSFPNQESLPRVLTPLRYLFLGSAYWKARLTYVILSVCLYILFVLPGPSVIAAFNPTKSGELGAPFVQTWPLLVALFLVGVVPNSLPWLDAIEAQVRGFVHSWFLVPDGALRMVALLEDARYSPPAWLIEALESQRSTRLFSDLRVPPAQPEYRWARATMILEALKKQGLEANPLERVAFAPFDDDFGDICRNYRLLQLEADAIRVGTGVREGQRAGAETAPAIHGEAADFALRRDEFHVSVGRLLRQMYGYINWGVRQQVNSEKKATQLLEDFGFGFRLPVGSEKRLFDVVFPAILSITLWSFVWALVSLLVIPWTRLHEPPSKILVLALSSATAAACMFGFAISSALSRRSAKIEERTWVQTSPRCFVGISIVAGFVSWLVIVASTIFWHPDLTVKSLIGLWDIARTLNIPYAPDTPALPYPTWLYLPLKISTALPWFLVGAVAAAMLVYRLGGDVRRTHWRALVRDGLILGGTLGLAAAFAQDLQLSLDDVIVGNYRIPGAGSLSLPSLFTAGATEGIAESIIGLIMGLVVPFAFRSDILSPSSTENAKQLRDTSAEAQKVFPDPIAAGNWLFEPHAGLGKISPAEALHYNSLVNRVPQWLRADALGLNPPQDAPVAPAPDNLLPLRRASGGG
jgi:hypothetical protein